VPAPVSRTAASSRYGTSRSSPPSCVPHATTARPFGAIAATVDERDDAGPSVTACPAAPSGDTVTARTRPGSAKTTSSDPSAAKASESPPNPSAPGDVASRRVSVTAGPFGPIAARKT
jgi:hypothetical protein